VRHWVASVRALTGIDTDRLAASRSIDVDVSVPNQ
jgi:hypothetical protein